MRKRNKNVPIVTIKDEPEAQEIEVKTEPAENPQSCGSSSDHIQVKTEQADNEPPIVESKSDNAPLDFSDIIELDEQQLAMRIYQTETGIKHLYFVLLTKTEKRRYLLKAKKLKREFVPEDRKQVEKSKRNGRGRKAESIDEMIARADPNKIDANDLRRIFMSEEEKARIRAKSVINNRRRRENMTEEELAESRAKDRDRMARRNRKAKAGEETKSQYEGRKRANDHGKEARKGVNLDHDIRKHLRRCETPENGDEDYADPRSQTNPAKTFEQEERRQSPRKAKSEAMQKLTEQCVEESDEPETDEKTSNEAGSSDKAGCLIS